MNEVEEWFPWVYHDLGGCPLRSGDVAELVVDDVLDIRYSTIVTIDGDYSKGDWNELDTVCSKYLKKTGKRLGIYKYRLKKPDALIEMLKNAAGLDESYAKEVKELGYEKV